MSAVCANLPATNFDMREAETKTYELCFNAACIALARGEYAEAKAKLERAERMCRETLEGEEPEEAEGVEREVAVIRAQLAFCLQKLGQTEQALQLYGGVLRTKGADVTVGACVANNLVCINRDQNVFDSKRRIKAATAQELRHKLTNRQRALIAYNEILFCIITSQNKLAQQLLERYVNEAVCLTQFFEIGWLKFNCKLLFETLFY